METRIPPSSSGISRSDEKVCVCFGDNRIAIGMQHKGITGTLRVIGDSGLSMSFTCTLCSDCVRSIKVGWSHRSSFEPLCNSVSSSLSLES